MFGSALICMGWGLVGYLDVYRGGEQANIFSTLPAHDFWITVSRITVLATLLPTLPLTLQPGRSSLLRLIRVPLAIKRFGTSVATSKLKNRTTSQSRHRRPSTNTLEDDDSVNGSSVDIAPPTRPKTFAWTARAVAVIAWICVAIAAELLLVGGNLKETGEGIASAAEILGAIGSTMSGFIVPSKVLSNLCK